MKNVICWSGGKDSTATIILAHRNGIKLDHIIISMPWFDKKKEIYADHPAHVDWVLNYAKPLFESWGYHVDIVSDDKDYLYWFYKVIRKSAFEERNGLFYGFVIGGMCKMNQSKTEPIQKFIKSIEGDVTVYEGIAADEINRLEGMRKKRNHVSLLEQYGINEIDTYQICSPLKLLSPIYKNRKRQGCWFCPNQNAEEAMEFKKEYPDIWKELLPLAEITAEGKTNAKCFSYNKTFEEFEAEMEKYDSGQFGKQMTLFELFDFWEDT